MKIVKSRLLVAYFIAPLLIPHLLFYTFSKNRLLIRSDVGGVFGCLCTGLFMTSLIGMFSITE